MEPSWGQVAAKLGPSWGNSGAKLGPTLGSGSHLGPQKPPRAKKTSKNDFCVPLLGGKLDAKSEKNRSKIEIKFEVDFECDIGASWAGITWYPGPAQRNARSRSNSDPGSSRDTFSTPVPRQVGGGGFKRSTHSAGPRR